MAGMTKDSSVDPVSDAAEGGVDPRDPFRGNSQKFTWARGLEVGQLQDEVVRALGPDVQVAVLHNYDEGGGDLPVDSQNPVTVFVTPSSTDIAALKAVMSAHRPDPYYGLTDEQKAQVQLKEKIAAGEPLTPQELTMALQMVLA